MQPRPLVVALVVALVACSAPVAPRPVVTPAPEATTVAEAPPDESVATSVEPPSTSAIEAIFSSDPITLDGERERKIELRAPAATTGRWPLVVLLHATCMQPGPVCDAFGQAGGDVGWLVCPAGNSSCAGEPDWGGPGAVKAAFLDRALDQAKARLAPFVAEQPGVLVGWSRGAFAAIDILATPSEKAAPHFRALVLIAASVSPSVRQLEAAGIHRIVLAAGDFDQARSSMMTTDQRLRAAGFASRYVSLGAIGHSWPGDFEARMREPIAWVGGTDLTFSLVISAWISIFHSDYGASADASALGLSALTTRPGGLAWRSPDWRWAPPVQPPWTPRLNLPVVPARESRNARRRVFVRRFRGSTPHSVRSRPDAHPLLRRFRERIFG